MKERLTEYESIAGHAHAVPKGDPNLAIARLAYYEDLEEQGRLVVLPCKVGDTIYKIPSKENRKLNIIRKMPELNRVYEQKICRIEFYENGVYLPITCNGADAVHSDFFGMNWFLTREEAEQALGGAEG